MKLRMARATDRPEMGRRAVEYRKLTAGTRQAQCLRRMRHRAERTAHVCKRQGLSTHVVAGVSRGRRPAHEAGGMESPSPQSLTIYKQRLTRCRAPQRATTAGLP